MLISIEIMLLSITFLILVSSINLDDIIGQVYAVYIIVIAGAESAIGLAILVAFYRLDSLISLYDYFILNLFIPCASYNLCLLRSSETNSCYRCSLQREE
jgi:hypothetical protein